MMHSAVTSSASSLGSRDRSTDGLQNRAKSFAPTSQHEPIRRKVGACDLVAEVAYGAIENITEKIHLFVIEIEMHARSFRGGSATQ